MTTLSYELFYNKLQNLLQRQQYPQMQYPHELQLRYMLDWTFNDCIFSRLQHQWKMTPLKCLQSHSKYSGHNSQLFCLLWCLTDWLASLAFRAAKWRANNFGKWCCLTQLTLWIAPPYLECFKRNGLFLCRGMSDKLRTNSPHTSLHFNKVVLVFCFSRENFFVKRVFDFIWSLLVSTLKMSALWRQNLQIIYFLLHKSHQEIALLWL